MEGTGKQRGSGYFTCLVMTQKGRDGEKGRERRATKA